jgi:glycosyltransferase involved in cell wall biosynthesis
MQWWFDVYLATTRRLGYRIVWTAHDLVPHEQVFEDDAHARDLLISRARVVIALSDATANELRELGARTVRVIPIGSYADPYPVTLTASEARASFGFHDEDVVVALIGRLEWYKGADLLLSAAAHLPPDSKIKVLLAGLCSDEDYRHELMRLRDAAPDRVAATFEWVGDEDLARHFQAADVAVFPFREITNSASVLLAQSFHRPVVIPDLSALSDIPSDGALRFSVAADGPGDPLVAALLRMEHLTPEEYREMGDAAFAWASRNDWPTIARETMEVYRLALEGSPTESSRT